MRKIERIIIHCTATREGQDWSVEQIRKMHIQQNGWADIGYHYLIYRDGSVHTGRPVEKAGAHTAGYNATSIGVCYVGGCDKNLKPKDTRTPEQKKALISLIRELKSKYPNATIHGHREFAAKACPSFDVQKWLKEEFAETGLKKGEGNSVQKKVLLAVLAVVFFVISSCGTSSRIENNSVEDVRVVTDSVIKYVHDTSFVKIYLRDSIVEKVFDSSYTDSAGVRHHDRETNKEYHHDYSTDKYNAVVKENEELRNENSKLKSEKEKTKIVEQEKKVYPLWPYVVTLIVVLALMVYIKIKAASKKS